MSDFKSYTSRSNISYLSQNARSSQERYEGDIYNWLCLIGFSDFVMKVDFDQPYIEEIKDGIFIANLLQTLENKEIRGLILEPKRASCCILNIRKAFSLIRGKKDIDNILIEHEYKVYEAERNYIFALLNNLKFAYRQKTNYYDSFNKSQSRSQLSSNLTMTYQPMKAEQLFYSKKENEFYVLNKKEWSKSIIPPKNAKI